MTKEYSRFNKEEVTRLVLALIPQNIHSSQKEILKLFATKMIQYRSLVMANHSFAINEEGKKELYQLQDAAKETDELLAEKIREKIIVLTK